ncbi:uncharacterized protein LOC109839738 [Asparagus officinalis]|uniref:uncharacterized protein LOC109839738 n=1 Tax=Asparagus officinalis TaxID=4686 RepID=UPI00098E69A3|nr:uncharacterized protein LOC109839738 [Asparagus officinalis]
MSDIIKREFAELAVDGSNYLTWALDVEIYLNSFDLSNTIAPASQSTSAQKAKALIFLRHHLNKDLKNEYLTEKDPAVLWQSLKDRFDQQTAIMLPQAQYDWLNLRFQDFKSVTEYNSTLHRIVSQLKLCKQNITEAELIEKTLSTFHASNLVLQQQYMTKNYSKHSELISALLVAEKHNQLLMRNHNARPVGSLAVPEAHATNQSNTHRCGRGRGRGHGRGSYRGGRGRGRRNANSLQDCNKDQNKDKPHSHKPSSHQQVTNNKQACYQCGCEDHWSRTCRTPKHLVEAYQRMLKDSKGKSKHGETHHASLPEANMTLKDDNYDDNLLKMGDMNMDDDDLLKMELDDFGDQE